MYVSLLNRIFNWAVNWKLIMLALKTDLVLALVWNSVWKIATTFGIFSGFARLEKKSFLNVFVLLRLFCFCFLFFSMKTKCLTKRKVKKWRINRFHEKKQKTTTKKKKQRMRKWHYTTKLLNHKRVSWRRLVQSFRAIDKILNIKVLCHTGQSKLSLAF